MKSRSSLLLFLVQNEIAAWHFDEKSILVRLPIEAQERLHIPTTSTLISAINDISDRLRASGWASVEAHLVLDEKGRTLLNECLRDIAPLLGNAWQIFHWSWLLKKLSIPKDANWRDDNFFNDQILPWLTADTDANFHAKLQEQLKKQQDEFESTQLEQAAQFQENLKKQQDRFESNRLEQENAFNKQIAKLEAKIQKLTEQHATDIDALQIHMQRSITGHLSYRARMEKLHAEEISKLNKRIERLKSRRV